jgi:hypothetical protein
LRYGLIEVEPFEEQRIVEKFGMKFRERRWGVKPCESFPDFVRFNTQAVLESISLPSHLDRVAIAKVISERRIEAFESDTEFKKILEEVEVKGKRSDLRRLVEFFVARQKAHMDDIFLAYAGLFAASNLQLSFISDFTDYEVSNLASLEAISRIVKYYTMRMKLPGRPRSDFRVHQKLFSGMKLALSPVIDQAETTSFRAQALKWYVLLSNSENAETAFEPKMIDKNKMDEGELKRLHWEFRQESMKLRKSIMEQEKGPQMFHPLVEESDLRSSFGEIVMAMTS